MKTPKMKTTEIHTRLHKIRASIADDPAKAIERLEALLKEPISITEAITLLPSISAIKAESAFVQEDFELCIIEATTCINSSLAGETAEANAELRSMYFLRGKSYLYQDKSDPQKCLSDLASAAADNALDRAARIDLYKSRGAAFGRLERFEEAIVAFNAVRELAPEDTVNLLDLAKAYVQTEAYSEAEEALISATHLHPNSADILCQLGDVHFKRSDFSRAEAVFTKAITLNGNNALFYERRAITRNKLSLKSAADDWMIAKFLASETG